MFSNKNDNSINLILWILKPNYCIFISTLPKYKFDPMDFETIKKNSADDVKKGINLILWILKQAREQRQRL